MLRVRAASFLMAARPRVHASAIKETLVKHAAWILAPILLLTCAMTALAQAPSTDLKKLFDDEWAWRMREDPLFATSVGDHRYDDKLPSVAVADHERRANDLRAFQKRLQAIDRTKLGDTDRMNYDI